MRIFFFLAFLVVGWSDVLSVRVPAPEYEVVEGRLLVAGATYLNPIGAPDIPSRSVTIALPPGAKVVAVSFHGMRHIIGRMDLSAAEPPLPLSYGDGFVDLQHDFEESRVRYYNSDFTYPQTYGIVIADGGLRKYTLITVACQHFAYNPARKSVFCAPHVDVEIQYSMPVSGSAEARYWQRLRDDVTFDELARELIYNWHDAQIWYHTNSPRRANGYYIIIPSAILNAVDALVAHRQSQGYDVHVVTKEYIETNVAGNDVPQKFRNYLRANMEEIEYALLVGFSADMPWRDLVPFNNDPYSPWNDPDYSPIPGDLYLAELTDSDSSSWNSDGDSYYGEVFDANFQPPGDDNPDYHADIHLGRIPFSTPSVIEDICAKIIAFDTNTDVAYKTSSLLTGALYYYANENNSGNARRDGGDYCEQLLIDSILPRATATTLYEKAGLAPCTLSCSDSLNQNNHIAYWQNKGVMYECHHGNVSVYARKVWSWDDGDSIPQTQEITWPVSLYITDVYQLDNNHPATCFLRSCLCGKPEETGIGAMLLYRGGSAVISSSRISWSSSAYQGGIPYHFYDRLMIDTLVSSGIIGKAYDMAKNDFMGNTGFWLPAYHYNLFGDPALRQFGQLVNIEETGVEVSKSGFMISPNPSHGIVAIKMHAPLRSMTEVHIYDVMGRLVEKIEIDEHEKDGFTLEMQLPAGVYFVSCLNGEENIHQKKIVVVE
jgi:hypothetical protein